MFMRSRISLPIADHPTILDSKNIMSYIDSLKVTAKKHAIIQDIISRCWNYCVQPPKRLNSEILNHPDIISLIDHSWDSSIVGLNEYQKLVFSLVSEGVSVRSEYPLCFHDIFVRFLSEMCPLSQRISIEENSIDEIHLKFPAKRGIYFCLRTVIGFRLDGFKNEVWYVGKSGNFRERWKSHHKFEALKAIKNVAVCWLPLEDYSDEQLSYAEEVYIYMLQPVFNGTSKPERCLVVN